VPRGLNRDEANLVDGVFNTDENKAPIPVKAVPPEKIRITPLLGINDRPLTLPASFLSIPVARVLLGEVVFEPLFAVAAVGGLLWSDKCLVNLGPRAYDGGATLDDVTFVHECTHVWQGMHWPGFLNWAYVFDAIFNRTYDYGYSPTTQWNNYGAEQQATIVEEWYGGSAMRPAGTPPNVPPYLRMDKKNPAFRFIKRNVWTGRQNALSDEGVLSGVSTSLYGVVAAALTASGASGQGATGEAAVAAAGGSGVPTWAARRRVGPQRMM
jgi:hypothetical protein